MEIAFSSPGARPLHGAAFTFGDDASACVVRTPVRLVPPSTERVLESAEQFQEQFEIASPVILTKAGTSGSPARCGTRFLAAEIMGPPAAPSYPDIAREQGATGTASVLVRVAPDGSSTGTDIVTSSGNPALDGSALNAARATNYRGAIFDCEPVADSYIFRAEFAESGSLLRPVTP
jgi:TonB family protein